MRRARSTDLDALLSLYAELVDGKATAAPGSHDESWPVIERVLADPARHLIVAELADQVIGTADLLLVPNLTHHGMPWGIIENVVVTANSRREGAGKALFEELIRIARSAGCCKVQLLSGKRRTDAHEFYRSVGLDSVAEGFKLYFDD